MASQRREHGCFHGCHFVACWLEMEKGRKVKEREKGRWGIYKGMEMNIIMLPFLSKPKETHQRKLRLHETKVASWAK